MCGFAGQQKGDMKQVFTDIYEKCIWGDGRCVEYRGSSGPGSEVCYNAQEYVPFLRHFIFTREIKSIVDMGCGDFKCGPLIYEDFDVTYTGYDVYDRIIIHNKNHYAAPKYNFECLDFFNRWNELTDGDLCIMKDVIQHWSLGDIYSFLDRLVHSRKFKMILLCNCAYQTQDNTDIETGGFRPLSCEFFPLRRYSPKKMFTYETKEVSLIEKNRFEA